MDGICSVLSGSWKVLAFALHAKIERFIPWWLEKRVPGTPGFLRDSWYEIKGHKQVPSSTTLWRVPVALNDYTCLLNPE